MTGMQGKTLVISGATRGIGKAILYRFAQNGVNVAFTYNKNEEEAIKIVQEVQELYGIKAKYYRLDILEPEQYVELFKQIDNDFDRVDCFVSNAIIYGRSVVGGFAPFMRLKPKGLNNIYTATVLAFVVGAQEAAKRMKLIGGGAIVSLSSTGNLVYMPNYAGHGNSKNAVETMVKYAAVDLGEFGIRVNAVSGGPIDTDALKAFPDYAEIKAKVEEQSPLKRMGNPEDLAGAVYFLCDPNQSGWLTGQTIVVDGGTTFK
ncbi:7-alpha-hydroxysteroid dehydrogenase HdhA [Helicobacter suis]|uniref:7-alpha-hydroxysteroid dehydrogenase n=3 Tax=Helicobacter suis TaxID=104628 RepID=E7G427_9HELI|nr:7-alpha-hydroxysteroid dehydrogenase [Helicobacter suis HS5]BCD45759.1 7-alpha-hydroxysteroid dehydrogenase HdhA [Helicobacter suis]BCD48312.1 7-alpha-hydroxysteroid dehydrogenase HdhA [Helicobacter suis]BCD50073.1 7-alpha-hydroxysteroid dehydrogenase HdhA [Helicobacter suis]BCD51840.1 7-alpha-hydroxysteroid dehydrogenase HdhA [Helicobacter suis]